MTTLLRYNGALPITYDGSAQASERIAQAGDIVSFANDAYAAALAARGDHSVSVGSPVVPSGVAPVFSTFDQRLVSLEGRLGGYVLPAPSGDVTGATDTAALNAVLTLGGKIRPNSGGGLYYLSAPLKLAAGGYTDVDFGTMTFRLLGKYNLLQNAAVTPSATATDVATVAGSSNITSPQLVAAGAAVGMAVGIPAGGPVGSGDSVALPMWTYGIITGVAGNVITLGGNANGVAAHNTLAGATGYLFRTRDAEIKVRGGVWDAGTIWGTDYSQGPGTRWRYANDSSFLRFRRVDGLLVTGFKLLQTFPQAGGWCYGVDPADCTDVVIENGRGAGSSTVVNGTGPLKRITVRNISGMSQDDMVAFGTVGASLTDTEGDVEDVLIDGVMADPGTWRCVDLYSGQGNNGAVRKITNARVKSLKGYCQADACQFVTYGGNGTISADLEDITASFGAASFGGPYYKIHLPALAEGGTVTVKGPVKPGEELAQGQLLINATSPSDATGITLLTLPSFVVPPAGRFILELETYIVGQLLGDGVPAFYVTETGSNATYLIASVGNVTVGKNGPGMCVRERVGGQTPGATLTFKVVLNTTNGTQAKLFAGANFPTQLRVLAVA